MAYSKALTDILAQINKNYGAASIVSLNDSDVMKVKTWASTGSLGLDIATGIGGTPQGRIIELFGPESSGKTTLCLHMIAEVQKVGEVCAFIDVEHSFDPFYFKALGGNPNTLIFSQPDNGEHALNIVESLVLSKEVALIVIDSVAALVPKAEIDGEMGDMTVGLQARLMSRAMRKLAGIAEKSKTTLIFTNQLRQKIGVIYGCVQGDTHIDVEGMGKLTIQEIVSKKIKGKVWSYNFATQQFERKEILNWFNNGVATEKEDFLNFETKNDFGFALTKDHLVLTKDEDWVSAEELKVGDFIYSFYENKINCSLKEFLEGTIIGDTLLDLGKIGTESVRIVLQDNHDIEYSEWKREKLSSFFEFSKIEDIHSKRKDNYKYVSQYNYDNYLFYKETGEKERNPLKALFPLTPMKLALYICDDGSLGSPHKNDLRYNLSMRRKSLEKYLSLIVCEFNQSGFKCFETQGRIIFTLESSKLISQYIREFVPLCMEKKLFPEDRGFFKDFQLQNIVKYLVREDKITKISLISERKWRNKGLFDLAIEGNHNYLIGSSKYGGILIHNSPEVTTGGQALKFYASIRLDIRRKSVNKHTDDGIDISDSNVTKVKVVKNKMAPPFRECEFDIVYGEGIDRISEYPTVAENLGLFKIKKGKYHVNYSPTVWGEDEPIEGTLTFVGQALKDPECWMLKEELGLQIELKMGFITQEQYDIQWNDLFKRMEKIEETYQYLWSLGSEASSKSKPVEAFYYLTLALGQKPYSKECQTKLKAVEKRIEEKRNKGEQINFVVEKWGDSTKKINIETGEEFEIGVDLGIAGGDKTVTTNVETSKDKV